MTRPNTVFVGIPEASGIYQIRCVVNDKFYVGQAVNIRHRFKVHRTMLRNGQSKNPHLQSAWDKYGEDKFRFEAIELCLVDDLTVREARFMALLGSRDREEGYNIAEAGKSPTLGVGHTPETTRKIVETKRGNGTLRLITINGETKSLTEWAAFGGLSVSGFSDRLNAGRSPEEALSDPKLGSYQAFGRTATLHEFCEEFDVLESRVAKRIQTYGWTLERALTEVNLREKYTVDGVAKSLPGWCKEYGVPYARTVYRVSNGWGLVEALTTPKLGVAA